MYEDEIDRKITFEATDKSVKELFDEIVKSIMNNEPVIFDGKAYVVTSCSVTTGYPFSTLEYTLKRS